MQDLWSNKPYILEFLNGKSSRNLLKVTENKIKKVLSFIPLACLVVILVDRALVQMDIIQESFIFKLPVWAIWCIMIPATLLPIITLIDMNDLDNPNHKGEY